MDAQLPTLAAQTGAPGSGAASGHGAAGDRQLRLRLCGWSGWRGENADRVAEHAGGAALQGCLLVSVVSVETGVALWLPGTVAPTAPRVPLP